MIFAVAKYFGSTTQKASGSSQKLVQSSCRCVLILGIFSESGMAQCVDQRMFSAANPRFSLESHLEIQDQGAGLCRITVAGRVEDLQRICVIRRLA